MDITNKLNQIVNIKQDIKTAIEEKGIDLQGVDFSGYADKIREIIPMSPPEENISFDVTTTASNLSFTLPITSNGVAVDWGDGTSNWATSSYGLTHTYPSYNGATTYRVKLSGHIGSLANATNNANAQMIGGILFLYPSEPMAGLRLSYTRITQVYGNKNIKELSLAFSDCRYLTKAYLPYVTNEYGQSLAFCALTEVVMPKVTTLGDIAFRSCSNLKSLNLPKVTTLGDRVFWSCNNLTSLKLTTNEPITTQSTAFDSFLTAKCELTLGTYEYSQADLAAKTWKGKVWKDIFLHSS